MYQMNKVNLPQSWWGPRNFFEEEVIKFLCPTNLTADSTFSSGSHCPVNSFGDPLNMTADTTIYYTSGTYNHTDED